VANIIIEGDEAVRAKLTSLGALANPTLQTAIMAAAGVIQTDAKVRVRKLTGNLARSIHTEPLGTGAVVGTDVVYAAAQEFGRPDLPNYGYTPYLRPAVDQNLAKIEQTIALVLGRLIQS